MKERSLDHHLALTMVANLATKMGLMSALALVTLKVDTKAWRSGLSRDMNSVCLKDSRRVLMKENPTGFYLAAWMAPKKVRHLGQN